MVPGERLSGDKLYDLDMAKVATAHERLLTKSVKMPNYLFSRRSGGDSMKLRNKKAGRLTAHNLESKLVSRKVTKATDQGESDDEIPPTERYVIP